MNVICTFQSFIATARDVSKPTTLMYYTTVYFINYCLNVHVSQRRYNAPILQICIRNYLKNPGKRK